MHLKSLDSKNTTYDLKELFQNADCKSDVRCEDCSVRHHVVLENKAVYTV